MESNGVPLAPVDSEKQDGHSPTHVGGVRTWVVTPLLLVGMGEVVLHTILGDS